MSAADPRRDAVSGLPIDPDSGARPGRPFHLTALPLALVLVGGIAGTAGRVGLEELFAPTTGWPMGTFIANLAGAALLGVLLEALARSGSDHGRRRAARLLLGTGACGAFTTYSTFALEVSRLVRDDAPGLAGAYAVASVVGGIVAAWLGIVVAASVHRRVGGAR